MTLIRNQDWLKQAGRQGAGKDGKAEQLWRAGKIEKVGFKARKKLIAGERDRFKGLEGSRADDCGGVECVRSKGS